MLLQGLFFSINAMFSIMTQVDMATLTFPGDTIHRRAHQIDLGHDKGPTFVIQHHRRIERMVRKAIMQSQLIECYYQLNGSDLLMRATPQIKVKLRFMNRAAAP